MLTMEQIEKECSELLLRWDRLVAETEALPLEQKEDFIDVSVRTGVVEKVALMREICENPAEARRVTEDPEKLIFDTTTDLTVLEEGVTISGRLGIPVRNAVLATARTEADRISAAEAERIRAGTIQAVVPAVLSVAGGIVTSLIVSAVTGGGA